MILYNEEHWCDIEYELKQLFSDHWEEIARDKEIIKLNPDYKKYQALDKAGVLQVVTVRTSEEQELVGYHVSLIHSHLHYSDSLTAFTDIFFLKQEYRKGRTGIKLFQFVEKCLKQKGVQKIYMGTKLHLDISNILEYLGYTPIEKIYTKLIGD